MSQRLNVLIVRIQVSILWVSELHVAYVVAKGLS